MALNHRDNTEVEDEYVTLKELDGTLPGFAYGKMCTMYFVVQIGELSTDSEQKSHIS